MLKSIAAAVALFALTASAQAADLGRSQGLKDEASVPGTSVNWSGFYAGGGVGYDANSAGPSGEEGIFSPNGVIVTGRIGFDKQLGRTVLGVFGDVDWNNAAQKVEGASIDGDYSFALGVRAGVLLDSVLFYGNAGWQWSHFTIQGFEEDKVKFDPDGLFLGAGIEAPLGNGFSVALEGRKIWSDDTIEGEKIDNNDYQARLMVFKKF